MKTIRILLAGAAVLVASLSASAVTVYLGSWQVDEGPEWESQPLSYTGQQAAVLLFSSVTGDTNPTHYDISTVDSTLANINYSAWYSVIGYPGGTVFAQDYVAPSSSQGLGYYYSGSYGSWSGNGDDAASAYVRDNADGPTYTNYAFYKGAVIPEPSTYAMVMAGLALAVVAVRRLRR